MRAGAVLMFIGTIMGALPVSEVAAQEPRQPGFVGSSACRVCHPTEFKSWKESLHSRVVLPRDDGILKDAVRKWHTDGTNSGPTTGNVTGKTFSILDVKYVIGSNWKQRYAVRNETSGGYQFLNKQFNRVSGLWEPYGNKNDWDTSCASCHTTGYQLIAYDPATPKATRGNWTELGVGCEVCHGPGGKHVKSKKKKDIWTATGQPPEVQARLCGYCHSRIENKRYLTAQGNYREDLPAAEKGQAFMPWNDWRKWYPDQAIIPGVHGEDAPDASYSGDLKGMFIIDETSRSSGLFEEGKHHQQYQGLIQSAHYKKAGKSCISCHGVHEVKGKPKKIAAKSCTTCHDSSYTAEKYMPHTAKTADSLFVRSHTFNPKPRKDAPGTTGKPDYYY